MEGSRRLLDCLECPYAKSVNFSSRGDVLLLVTWLEDRKVRELEIEEREKLRRDHAGWDGVFDLYLKKLGCPFQWSPLTSNSSYVDCLVWLISHAIASEYEDLSEDCAHQEDLARGDEIMELDSSLAATPSTDQSSAYLGDEVDKLGSLVALKRKACETDPEFLQRISRQVRLFLTAGSLKSLVACGAEGIPLEEFPLGFDTQDAVINQVALVLRMLYISDFRELQNDLNALIVLGQEYTANPKTNSAQGKVGR